ncbi:hypothetical protein CEXT_430241 [Caerostris extrusa]|uniref:Uncharacterized protein n=1 Tax=Caerostris extrusa TaxID=172846 RepID=A0AAV4Y123_CAEEX|nr:hypothetical protein CEXT_430241 [Caerostris extrusa]
MHSCHHPVSGFEHRKERRARLAPLWPSASSFSGRDLYCKHTNPFLLLLWDFLRRRRVAEVETSRLTFFFFLLPPPLPYTPRIRDFRASGGTRAGFVPIRASNQDEGALAEMES